MSKVINKLKISKNRKVLIIFFNRYENAFPVVLPIEEISLWPQLSSPLCLRCHYPGG